MSDKKGATFYFFDFDDNIMFLETPLVLLNTETKETKEVSTGEFANINTRLGQPGQWADWAIYDGTFKFFNDIPEKEMLSGEEQYFAKDVRKATSAASKKWQAPSWKLFQGACRIQAPLSIVTARGHSPKTIKAGIKVLVESGLIEREPNYHTIYPVSNKEVRLELGDSDLNFTIPNLKKRAIKKTVDDGVKEHNPELSHKFGMSDDDPSNVRLIVAAMRDCKEKYPENRFFVINTREGEKVKLEIFPYNTPVNTEVEYEDMFDD